MEAILFFVILYFIFTLIYYLSSVNDRLHTTIEKLNNFSLSIPDGLQAGGETENATSATSYMFNLTPEIMNSIRNYDNCTICTDALNDNATITTCGHIFHNDCLNSWLDTQENSGRDNTNCPICRTVLTESGPETYTTEDGNRGGVQNLLQGIIGQQQVNIRRGNLDGIISVIAEILE